ncbi:MAG: hypothetical protein ACYTHM_21195, partial [Planctomycetota bacterium]
MDAHRPNCSPLSFSARGAVGIALWLAALGYGPVHGQTPPPFERLTGEWWMGIYVRKEKAGWVRSAFRREPWEGRDLWCFQSASTLRFTQFNKNIELRSSERTGYALHPPYGLVFHESTLTTREGRTRTTIRRNGETFEVEIVRG